ncbi:MAG TPA: DUF3127 domain-containing protein [Cyclobacteriaceae bacterium]|nr:DUF3127 domain-containing protein [Cyclobacteriaceae bacterium]
MQLTGKIVYVPSMQSGTGKNGEWRKQEVILETEGQYPKKVCIAVWGDRINSSQLVVGNQLKVDFDIESREYNSRWYTEVKAWKIEVVNADAARDVPPPAEMPPGTDDIDDLPF